VRGIPSFPDKLWTEVEGDIENVDGRPVVTTIRVKYHVKVPKEKQEAAQRALQFHVDKCPAALSVKRGIAIEWSSEIEEE
jgi:uncharacterized OsmC-like protein